MKTRILLFVILIGSLKNLSASIDTIPPVISITGSTNINHVLNSIYSDMGATALDDVDGNITANIISSFSPVNPDVDQAGTYNIIYTVQDAAGNVAIEHRIVRVYNEAEIFACNLYDGFDTCNISPVFNYNGTITASTTINKRIIISNFGGFGTSLFINADVNGTVITFPVPQSVGGNASLIAANGNITSFAPLAILVTYHWTDGTATEVCSSFYTTSCFTSVEENPVDKISIYPNPSNGRFHLSSKNNDVKNILVYNLQGRLILNNEIISREFEIDLSDQSNGIYFVTINTSNGALKKKIILNK